MHHGVCRGTAKHPVRTSGQAEKTLQDTAKHRENSAAHCRMCFLGVPRWVLEAAAGWAGWPGGWPASRKIYKVGKTAENAPLARGFPRFPKSSSNGTANYRGWTKIHNVSASFFKGALGGSNAPWCLQRHSKTPSQNQWTS